MKKYTYKLRTDSVKDEKGIPHRVYGIEIWLDNEYISAFKDISTDIAVTENLVSLCSRLKLSPVHLRDVIEDSIS